MTKILGTQGYEKVVQKFIEATDSISFQELHKDFLPFFPQKRSQVLDIGAGIGRDAHEFWKQGHAVVAVEPLKEFRRAAKALYSTSTIKWIDDALPNLKSLENNSNQFNLILSSGVWQHIDHNEQKIAIKRIAELLAPNGIFAVSLRNGSAIVATHAFQTDANRLIKEANYHGLKPILKLENQPSLMKNKKEVTWARLVLKKRSC